jgi:phosphoglycolate phosphatase
MKLKISAIVFDFDGVIVDSGADIANAVSETLKAFNQPLLSKEEIIKNVGRGAEYLIRSCIKDCSEELFIEAYPYYRKYYLENCILETRLYDNLEETLDYFKDKKLAVFTNKPEELTRKILEGLGVMKYFKLLVGPESVENLKPHPEGLLKILEAFGEEPQNAIMIGDTYTDVEVGKKAGTHTCGVTYGLGGTEELINVKPDFIIDNIRKLRDLIE